MEPGSLPGVSTKVCRAIERANPGCSRLVQSSKGLGPWQQGPEMESFTEALHLDTRSNMTITSGSHSGVTVDTDHPAFKHFLSWLAASGAPVPTIEEGEALGFGLKGADELVFTNAGKTFKGEAVGFYLSPSVSLAELQRELGFGNPMVAVPYPPYRIPVPKPAPSGDVKVDKPIPGRPGLWSVVAKWQGKVAFDEPTEAFGKKFVLVDEGGPWNRDGLWKEVA